MDNIKPINLGNEIIRIHGLRKTDMLRLSFIEDDIYEILSNIDNVQYIPQRHITNKEDVSKLLLGVTFGYETKSRWTHFISLVESNNKVIGQIDVLSPTLVEKNYGLKNIWLVEYLLHIDFWNKGIMTNTLGAVLKNIKEQGITNIGALCQRENINSIKVLEKVGFERKDTFDTKQDLFTFR